MVASVKNNFAYSPQFSKTWHENRHQAARRMLIASGVTTGFIGGLAAIFGACGLYPQAFGLAICTFMGFSFSNNQAVNFTRKFFRLKRRQKVLHRHLLKLEQNIQNPQLRLCIQTISKNVASLPLTFAYPHDQRRLHESFIEVSKGLSKDDPNRKVFQRVLNLSHGICFHHADGRVAKIDLAFEKTIFKGKTPDLKIKVETLSHKQKIFSRDLGNVYALFKNSGMLPDFAKKKRSLIKKLQSSNFKVIVARDPKSRKIIGMLCQTENKNSISLSHCVRFAEQPLERNIEGSLVREALSQTKNRRFKVVLPKSDSQIQMVFKKEGFAFAGVKSGLHGSLEDGIYKMERF